MRTSDPRYWLYAWDRDRSELTAASNNAMRRQTEDRLRRARMSEEDYAREQSEARQVRTRDAARAVVIERHGRSHSTELSQPAATQSHRPPGLASDGRATASAAGQAEARRRAAARTPRRTPTSSGDTR